MAVLTSPGVSISVIDQSINVGAGPGTIPLIFIATAQDKSVPGEVGIVAEGTTKANAGKLWSITSQRELVQTFGDPTFYSVSGSNLNGYPLNEYGLLAAYSYLGVANLCRVVRADIDTSQLEASAVEPTSPAAPGTYWLDESSMGTAYGLFVRSGSAPNETWAPVTINYEFNFATGTTNSPPVSAGTNGQYATVWQTLSGNLSYWRKINGTWRQIGVNYYISDTGATSVGTLVSVTSTQNLEVGMVPQVMSGTGSFAPETRVTAVISSTQFTVNIAPVTPLSGAIVGAQWGMTMASIWPNLNSPLTTATYWVKTGSAAQGANVVLRRMDATLGRFVQVECPILSSDVNANTYYSNNEAGSTGQIYALTFATGSPVPTNANSLQIRQAIGVAGPWNTMTNIIGSEVTPTQGPLNGQQWFNAEVGVDGQGLSTVDILVSDGAGGWENCFLPGFDELEVPVANPTIYAQSGDPRDNIPSVILSMGDVWINTDLLPYPTMYRWNGSSWTAVDLTDQTSPNGIIFRDARPNPMYHEGIYSGQNNGGGTNPDLDPDAPDADLYPKGFLLWNTRYSTGNVKVWQSPYVYNGVTAEPDETNNNSTGRWVNNSGNKPNGSPYMGSAAQNIVIVRAIQATITSNENIRSEDIFFNLIAAPGYVEAIDEMIALNQDRKETAFVVGDSPFTLSATGTALQNWSNNTSNAFGNGADGLTSASKFLGVWYPSGLSTNVDGTDVVVPPSHMALRTIAYNDQVAYPWFAPAGLQRGVVNNAASVGYVNQEGQYIVASLNEGQRDILYANGINPIRTMPQGGIVIFGQKTRQPYSSATDRINVVRLENYLRYQLDILAQPFLFEPNDATTRKAVKDAFDKFLSELITLRALYDYLVVCDLSNNTPARIDRNELWIDIAIQPVKAIEFIYIPIRIKNTGASLTV